MKTIYSIIEEKNRAPVKKVKRISPQKGSVLIGLIITMVVMAFLGAGMVYLTTTSTFQELFANNHARAYYVAESGGRYASSLFRQSLATGSPSLDTLVSAHSSNAGTTYAMDNGDQFTVRNWLSYMVDGSRFATFEVVGIVGSGFLEAKRMLTYRINPANQLYGLKDPYQGETNFPTQVSDFDNVTTPQLAQYFNPASADDTQVKLVKDDPKTGADPALNLVSPYYTVGLAWYTETNKLLFPQLDNIRAYNQGLLSYNIQVKIAPDSAANNTYFMTGISFRLDDNYDGSAPTSSFDNTYGLAFFKINPSTETNVTNKMPYWYKGITDPKGTDWSNIGIKTDADWQSIANDNYYYVVLYKRVGGTYGPHTLLAYKRLDGISGVLLNGVEIRDWTTLMVKVTEEKGGPGDLYGYTDPNSRYNTIKCFLQIPGTYPPNYPRRIGSTPEAKDAISPIKWDDDFFIPINWDWWNPSLVQQGKKNVDGAITIINNMIVDQSLNTLNYNAYNSSTTIKAREIGLHAYLQLEAANKVYLDNFYIDLSPSTTPGYGTVDGDDTIETSP